MREFILGLVFLALVSACNGPSPDSAFVSAPFDPSQAAYIKKQGGATLEGHAFLKDKGGSVKVAAGEIVRLVPATSFARARFAHYYRGTKFVSARYIPKIAPDADYAEYTRTTKSESNGRFSFDRVAPGSYFIATQLFWENKDEFFKQGGAFYEEVNVTGRETDAIRVILSGN
jgi:hypothetical protein